MNTKPLAFAVAIGLGAFSASGYALEEGEAGADVSRWSQAAPEPSPNFAWADENSDGVVELGEADRVAGLAQWFYPADQNGDGALNEREYDLARDATLQTGV